MIMFEVRPGQIISALISNPRNKEFKYRPALVLSADKDDQGDFFVVVAITTKFSNPTKPDELLIEPNRQNNLDRESAIKMTWGKIIEPKHVQSLIGSVDSKVLEAVWEFIDEQHQQE